MSGALKRDEWETVRLGDVATYVSDRIDASLLDTHNYVSVENLLADRRGIKDSENVPQTGRFIQYVSGDVLIGNIRPYLKKIWLAIHEGGTNGDVLVIRPNNSKNLSSEYLYHSLASDVFFNYAMQNAKGAKMPRGDKKLIMKYSFPLPPLDVQRRIAETLDKVTELITLRKTQLKKLDELVKARFVELFGDPEKNTFSWKEEELSAHLTVIGGYAFKSEQFSEEGIPVLRIGNINSGFFKPVNLVYWEDDDTLSRYKMYPGDLVMSLTGTVGKDDYGNVCILGNDYDVYYLNQRNAKLELQDTINKHYLSMLLRFEPIKKKLTGISRGVRQANISNKDILNLSVPIPPIELQNQFSAFVEQTDKSKVIIQQSLDTLETLKKSLMQEYFG